MKENEHKAEKLINLTSSLTEEKIVEAKRKIESRETTKTALPTLITQKQSRKGRMH